MSDWCIAVPGESLPFTEWDSLPEIRIAVTTAGLIVPDYNYWCAVDKCEPLEDYGYIDGKPRIMYKYGYDERSQYYWGSSLELVEDYMPVGSFALAHCSRSDCRFALFLGQAHNFNLKLLIFHSDIINIGLVF